MDLSSQLKLEEIPEPQRSTILAALTEIVLSKLAIQAFDRLSAEDKAYLDGLDETSTTPEDILHFLQSRIPDFDNLINQIIVQEKTELTDKTSQLIQILQEQKTALADTTNGT